MYVYNFLSSDKNDKICIESWKDSLIIVQKNIEIYKRKSY